MTIMRELMMEHATARKTVSALESALKDFLAGETKAAQEIILQLKGLEDLYPKHIQKEDKQFFYPSMKYFTQQEQQNMLEKCLEFSRDFTDKKYQKIMKILSLLERRD
jgi:hemerythrin-like domain-containing protein